jgi:uncharacterized repeat protein (TIGR01451 family)
MKKICYLFLFLASCIAVQAQNTYVLTPIPFNPDPFAAGTPTGIAQDDIYGGVVPLPFSFCFFDQSYDSVVIGSNGIVTFDLSVANQYCPFAANFAIPSPNMTDISIFGPMHDLNPATGGSIRYDVRGVAPYRRFIVSYDQVPMFGCPASLFTEQIILFETSNRIETHILDKPFCNNQAMGVHGIQVDSSLAYAVPGRNYPLQWTTNHDGFRFDPIGNCAGPPQTDSVSGKVFADYNNNCVQDVGEWPIMNRSVLANGGQFYGWTNAAGEYHLGMVAGSFAITDQPVSPFFASSCLPGGAHNVVLAGSVVNNADFADSTASICSDLTVSIGAANFRRCFATNIYVTYCNNGSHPDSNVVVTVTLLDSISLDSASMPYTALGSNVYSFAVGALVPGQCGNIVLHTTLGCDTAGTVYCVSADIAGTFPTECNSYNNADNDCHALVAPLDPNDKTVAAQDFSTRGYVFADNIDDNDELSYMIRFQNVGTIWAQDVVIRDTIDAALVPSSIRAGAASAPYNYVVMGNVVLFRFENINLPDSNSNEPGSHGFVKFSIQQRPGNPLGTVISNQASIYFDFEAPVVTNQTINTIPLASSAVDGLPARVQIYPNPGQDLLTVSRQGDEEMTFVLYDLAGKELRRVALLGEHTRLSTGDLSAGIYLYRLESVGRLLDAGKWMKQ